MGPCGYTYSFFRQLEAGHISTTDVLGFFADLGLVQVEIADPYVRADEFGSMQALLRETNLDVVCYDVVANFGSADPETRRSQPAHVAPALDRAAAVGARRVLLLPGPTDDEVSMEDARTWYTEGLRLCRPYAQELGLELMIANLGSQARLCGKAEDIVGIASRAGAGVSTTYDVGNYMMAEENPLAALNRVAALVRHVHLKDWRIEPPLPDCIAQGGYPGIDGRCFQPVPLGDGIIDLHTVVRRLHEMGYQGALTIEYEGAGDPKAAFRRSLDYLRALLADQDARD